MGGAGVYKNREAHFANGALKAHCACTRRTCERMDGQRRFRLLVARGNRGCAMYDFVGNGFLEGVIKNVPIRINHEELRSFAAMTGPERFITVEAEIFFTPVLDLGLREPTNGWLSRGNRWRCRSWWQSGRARACSWRETRRKWSKLDACRLPTIIKGSGQSFGCIQIRRMVNQNVITKLSG
ncbi:unnamed protein product [Prunus armeniaca]|uniref:Uncharacterized protein n=1 Tax=Prunus armeniaca TaxID=36596 RepID=A0A6J5TWQ4_PRUAR|nr:unnamed protein product [Prunus armeniaca]